MVLIVMSFSLFLHLEREKSKRIYTLGKYESLKNRNEEDVFPVLPEDLQYKLPKHKGVSNAVIQTKWWKSIAYIDLDIVRRPIDYKCKTIRAVGNWWICYDDKYVVDKPCLVYSFGINYNFLFDDAMAQLGCEVFSFDPSMNLTDHVRKNNVNFFQMGISNETSPGVVPKRLPYVKDKRKWIMMTLSDIKKKLGHQSRNLDVLKMDIESYEWDVIDSIIKDNMFTSVRQFIVEYHVMPPDLPKKTLFPSLLHTYKLVHDIGLRKFRSKYEWVDRNPNNFRYQVNVGYVNSRFYQE